MSKKLAIKGHSTRGKEVIELLEMMGGINNEGYIGTNTWKDEYYFLDNGGIHAYDWCDGIKFTLEEFLEKYPFKVGDRVLIPEYESEVRICEMQWDGFEIQYKVYRNEDPEWYSAEELLNYNDDFFEDKHCKNQVNGMKNVVAELLDHIKNTSKEKLEKEFNELEEWSHVGPTVEEFMDFCDKVNKKFEYPKTYEECCKILDIRSEKNYTQGYKCGLFSKFQELFIARDAYWKIAGEEMGLGKSWEPDFTNDDEERYGMYTTANKVVKDFCGVGDVNTILTFPTEEMRDAFYENFKDLIEQCKELL